MLGELQVAAVSEVEARGPPVASQQVFGEIDAAEAVEAEGREGLEAVAATTEELTDLGIARPASRSDREQPPAKRVISHTQTSAGSA